MFMLAGKVYRCFQVLKYFITETSVKNNREGWGLPKYFFTVVSGYKNLAHLKLSMLFAG